MDDKTIREFVQHQKNDYMLWKYGHQCLLAGWIENHMTIEKILVIIDWPGERDTSICNAYTDICERIAKDAGFPDLNSSYATHQTWALISDLILIIAKRDKSVAVRARKDKIKKLQSEITELEKKNLPKSADQENAE